MERRALGATDLAITPVGVGTAPIGSAPGVWWVNWGPQDEGEAVRAIQTALDAGVNWVDTAPFYGWGRAEEIVGRAIRGRGDVLDLVTEGLVRHGGISNHRPEEVERALSVGPVAAVQHEYSALARGVERKILPLARARGLGGIVWAPLASGFLTDGFSIERLHGNDFRRSHRFAGLELEPVRAVLRADDRTSVEGALAFVLSHAAVTGAIVGVRNEGEAAALARAAELRLAPDELAAIERLCPVEV